ncbi:hypothetical protein BD289DRAFT_165053 [Coniella lustricola]|uniref:Uncharacterized protein n=1 Tax=Coniella lustricola TaxID=2025994 RepID=A0A2T2ZUB7_9PEZI|nr:hypothetical protein BD289DRAFT_165053 [Coniella lustricola]
MSPTPVADTMNPTTTIIYLVTKGTSSRPRPSRSLKTLRASQQNSASASHPNQSHENHFMLPSFSRSSTTSLFSTQPARCDIPSLSHGLKQSALAGWLWVLPLYFALTSPASLSLSLSRGPEPSLQREKERHSKAHNKRTICNAQASRWPIPLYFFVAPSPKAYVYSYTYICIYIYIYIMYFH